MKLLLVRHGQSTYNLANKFTGWRDPPLSELGKNQAEETAIKLQKYHIDVIYSSSLIRAKQTAEIIIKNHPNSPKEIVSNPLLNERNYGNWAGKNKDEVKKNIGEKEFQAVRRGWNKPPEGGESLEDTSNRVKKWIEMIERARELEMSLGSGIKKIEKNEQQTYVLQRRCIRLIRNMRAGEKITCNDIEYLRPAPKNAFKPFEKNKIVGKIITKNKKKGSELYKSDIS